MPEEPAVITAEPAPAETPASAALSDAKIPSDPEQYANWRLTGELPKPEKKAESAPAKKPSSPKPVDAGKEKPSQEPEPAAEPEPAIQPQERKTSKAETRLNEILDDLRKAGLTPSELKTFKRLQSSPEDKITEPPPKAAAEAKPEKPAELTKPKLDDFKTLEEYEAAKDKYYEDLLDRKLQEQRAKDAQEASAREGQRKLEQAAQKYGEDGARRIGESAVAIFHDQQIDPGVKRQLDRSPNLTDVLFVMSENRADFEAFLNEARTAPWDAIERVVVLKRLVNEELQRQQKAAPRTENGQFAPATPAKRETKAPPPPIETGGRSSPPPDAATAAWQTGDVRGYIREMNRKELASRKLDGK